MSKPMLLETAHGPLSGVVSVPGSKSIANRALVCAALADGLSTLRAVPSGDDTSAMVDCLRTFGVQIQQDGTTADVRSCRTTYWWRRVEFSPGRDNLALYDGSGIFVRSAFADHRR